MALLNENRNRIPLVPAAPLNSQTGAERGQLRMVETEADTTVYVCTTSSLLAAELTVGSTPANSDVTFVANEKGLSGNSLAVEFIDPAVANAALSVAVASAGSPLVTTITVNLATDGASPPAITSTSADVAAAVAISAGRLVTATAEGTGVGVVEAAASAPLSGGDDDASVWTTL